MNSHDKNSSNDKRTDPSVSAIRNDAASQDASSGKSASGREPQKGGSVDNSTGSRDGMRDSSRTDGNSKR